MISYLIQECVHHGCISCLLEIDYSNPGVIGIGTNLRCFLLSHTKQLLSLPEKNVLIPN